jgi:hypothetical protein
MRTPARRSAARCAVLGGSVRFEPCDALGGSIGPLRAGIEKFGVRWNTVSCAACSAISGIDWIADEPVPITATRLPVKSTPLVRPAGRCGTVWPLKSSMPGDVRQLAAPTGSPSP